MKILKSFFPVLLLLILFGCSTSADAQSPSKEGVTTVRVLDISADKAWEQLRILDNIDKLSSSVSKVIFTGDRGVGGERVCIAADGKGRFKENITAFSDSERSYSYAVVEGVPAKNMLNTFKVVDMGYNKSMVVWTSNFEFMQNPQMTEEQFRGFLSMASGEMIDNAVKLVKS